jgi:hypothetical protein
MTTDPIVEQIHQIRRKLWEVCHGSAEEMAMRQQRLQRRSKGRLIDPEKWRHRKKAAGLKRSS